MANSSSTATVKSLPAIEALAGGADLFLGTELLGLTHAAKVSERQSSPSSTARPRLRGRPTTAEPTLARKREDRVELRGQVGCVSRLERSQRPMLLRILRLEPFGDLGEARVARDERRRAACGRLGGDHAERLREDRRRHADVRERPEMAEVAVLEGAGEEHALARRLAPAPRAPARSRRSPPARRCVRAPRAAGATPFSSLSFPT